MGCQSKSTDHSPPTSPHPPSPPPQPPPSAPPSAHVAYLSLWGSHPAWMVERWVERWGVDAATALIAANNATPHFGVRANAAMGVDAQGLLQACRDILSEWKREFAMLLYSYDVID